MTTDTKTADKSVSETAAYMRRLAASHWAIRYEHDVPFLAVAEEIERLTKERDAAFELSRCECESNEACANLVAKDNEIERLTAENAALRKDAERIDLLEKMANSIGGLLLHDGSETGRLGLGLRPGNVQRTLREAIDAVKENTSLLGCQGGQCRHASDCAVHNMPAYPAGDCDCSLAKEKT